MLIWRQNSAILALFLSISAKFGEFLDICLSAIFFDSGKKVIYNLNYGTESAHGKQLERSQSITLDQILGKQTVLASIYFDIYLLFWQNICRLEV